MVYDPNCVDKELTRGDSRRYKITVSEPRTGTNQDPPRITLTGADIRWTMKWSDQENKFRPIKDPSVVKTSDNLLEIETLDQNDPETEGQFVVKLVPADTKYLDPGIYAYDAQVTTAVGEVYTVVRGRIFLRADSSAAEDLTPP